MQTLAELALSDRFDEVKQSDFDTTEFRLSETGQCQRKRMLKALRYKPEEVSQAEAEYFERGNTLENWLVNQIVAKYPRKTRKQQKVITPWGDVGHIDIWFPNPPDKPPTIIEVKSVSEKARYYNLPYDDHVSQVQAYMHFLRNSQGVRRCNRAEIIYIFFGRRFTYKTFVVPYDELKGKKIEKELQQLHQWKNEGYIPPIPEDKKPFEYPCFWTTSDDEEHTCPMYRYCWGPEVVETEGVQKYEPVDDPAIKELFAQYKQVQSEYSRANKEVNRLKTQKKNLEAALKKAYDLRNTDSLVANNLQLKRVKISGRTYWDPEKAYKLGLINEDILNSIKSVSSQGSSYYRWYMKEVKNNG